MEAPEFEIARILHGSHLFGTSTPQSDEDWKAVFVPSARDVLLGNTGLSACAGQARDEQRRSGAGDVDLERHDLLRYVGLLAQGQPVALEMLFAPDRFHAFEPHPSFERLRRGADRFVSRESQKFVGYCRRQAAVYGLKGEKVAACERAIALLDAAAEELGAEAKLAACIERVVADAASAHVTIEPRTMTGGRVMRHLNVAGRLAVENRTVAAARAMVSGTLRSYGARARSAALADGKDWKALGHALRIAGEAVELLTTGRITLPRPDAARLRAVRLGQLDFDEVGAEIVALLDRVEAAVETSPLPEEPDQAFLEDVVIEAYAGSVMRLESAAPRP